MKNIFLYFILLLVIAAGGFLFSPFAREALLNLGIVNEKVLISGTGSMYPTFPKSEGVTDVAAGDQVVAQPEMKRFPGGITLIGRTFFTYKLQRGDIIEFESEKTKKITSKKYGKSAGFVKRIVGLPGEKVELRDGMVLINSEPIPEDYIAKPQSTFGGDFLADCRIITVPDNSVFVLGDNRKASLDSRFELGFVSMESINYVIPFQDQDELKKNWLKPEDSRAVAGRLNGNPDEFVNLLNSIRKDKKSKVLKIDPKLNNSAKIRGEIILETDDFSTEATRSGLTLEKAINKAGYRNILQAEVFAKGFFETKELLENLFEFPDTKDLLLSDEYQDIGLSPVISDINNCPTQVNVIHLGGFRPPNYQMEDVESWRKLIENLNSILPSWEGLQNAENIDREKVLNLVSVLKTRLTNAGIIYGRISKNQWLTDEENRLLDKDIQLHNEAEKLINELNAEN